jgi:RND superfamily putative drug exporter
MAAASCREHQSDRPIRQRGGACEGSFSTSLAAFAAAFARDCILLGMIVLGMSFLTGLAVSSALVVLFTMLAASTALPTMVSRIGGRVGTRGRRRSCGPGDAESRAGFWPR